MANSDYTEEVLAALAARNQLVREVNELERGSTARIALYCAYKIADKKFVELRKKWLENG